MAVALIAPLALLLLILAALSTTAAFFAHPGFAERVEARGEVAPAEALAVAKSEQSAASWFEPARHKRAAARALLALPAGQRDAHFGEVRALTEGALRKSPMSAYDWTLLAFLALQRGDVAAADRAWQTSVLFAPYAPELMRSRIELGARIARRDPGIEPALRDQVKLMALDPASLAAMARADGSEAFVRAALNDEPKLRAGFENETKRLVEKVTGGRR